MVASLEALLVVDLWKKQLGTSKQRDLEVLDERDL